MTAKPLLIVIAGPTAVGKTALSIRLAQYLQTEILSADSRQFFREMSIGTARPDKKEMQGIPHHFTGHLSISESYNVSDFEQDSVALLEQLFQKKNTAVMVGGSGLYIKAVCEGIDTLPDPDPDLRQQLVRSYENEGIEILQKRLFELDRPYYHEVDKHNPKRLMRAIEVCETTGKKYSDLRLQQPKPRPFRILKIGLELPRQELFERIHQRTDKMMEHGLLEEAKRLAPFRRLNALNTVGYKELFRYLDGTINLEQAVTDIKTNTRRYAKRQMTWFKKDTEFTWYHPSQLHEIIASITPHL